MAGKSIHVRLDEAAQDALRLLQRDGLNESQAVRTALAESAQRRRRRSELRAEIETLVADPIDTREREAVMREMEALAPDWPE